jgi:hypothetical protein
VNAGPAKSLSDFSGDVRNARIPKPQAEHPGQRHHTQEIKGFHYQVELAVRLDVELLEDPKTSIVADDGSRAAFVGETKRARGKWKRTRPVVMSARHHVESTARDHCQDPRDLMWLKPRTVARDLACPLLETLQHADIPSRAPAEIAQITVL